MEKRKRRGYWTYERCKAAAMKCGRRNEFHKRFSGAVNYAQKKGFYKELCSYFGKKGRLLTQEEFDQKRKEIHGNSIKCLDPYINGRTKLRFKCKNPDHPIFKQGASQHLNGNDCRKCADEKRVNY